MRFATIGLPPDLPPGTEVLVRIADPDDRPDGWRGTEVDVDLRFPAPVSTWAPITLVGGTLRLHDGQGRDLA